MPTAQHPQAVTDYFNRVNAEVLNFRRAMVKIYKGHYYIERCLIKINSDNTISCSDPDFAPTEEEAQAIEGALRGIDFPRTITARDTHGLPATGEVYQFLDRQTGEIIMVQERRTNKDGSKSYIPWVFLSTGQWIAMEPDGALPFWKPKDSKGPGARIMIHEGAKAAMAANNLPSDHPWAHELKIYEHWGLIGGALAPHRADYAELEREKPAEVIYVCDNDDPGRKALQEVSRCRRRALKGAFFGDRFPLSFDIADPIPAEMFSESGRFNGPRFHELLRPASWATDLIPPTTARGKPTPVIRREFLTEWWHCVTPECYIHRDQPAKAYAAEDFNSEVKPFSDTDNTAALVKGDISTKASGLAYSPAYPPGLGAGSKFINTYEPPNIKPEQGDPRPFLEFMEHLVPNDHDRHELMRWCATLIARPETRILYGVLAVSETQGVGKGTLGEKILAPLVGFNNFSIPTEKQLVDSNFNYWLAHKRLAVVHEIYAGQSSKAYNQLKSSITDRYVTVSKKYQPDYTVENWIHIFACSNSLRALKLSTDDRRWLVPAITDVKPPTEYWLQLNYWLRHEGGLQVIAYWARDFLKKHEAISPGAEAPWSAAKLAMIEAGYSPGQELAMNVLQTIDRRIAAGELAPDSFVIDKQLIQLIRDVVHDGRNDGRLEKPLTIRKIAKTLNWHCGRERIEKTSWGLAMVKGQVMSPDPSRAAMDVSANGPVAAPIDLTEWRQF